MAALSAWVAAEIMVETTAAFSRAMPALSTAVSTDLTLALEILVLHAQAMKPALTTRAPPYCARRCDTGFDHDNTSFSIEACAEDESCAFENGRWLCRHDLSVDVGGLCDGLSAGCLSAAFEFRGCVQQTPAVVVCNGSCDSAASPPRCVESANVPAAWLCPLNNYGTADGCDCGCGALDPDCADATAAACLWCDACVGENDPVCECNWPSGPCDVGIVANDNSRCLLPPP